VRTPMQWSADRHGGFTLADGATTPVSPSNDDPVYGYGTINAASQERDPDSLLTAIKRLIALRRQHAAFGRGTIEFLECGNLRVIAFMRRHGGETILVVANLTGTAQTATVELAGFTGAKLIDIIRDVEFPQAGLGPYTLTLAPYACHWLQEVQEG